jgi:hypothetical protein
MTPKVFTGSAIEAAVALFSLDDFKGSRLAVNLPRQLRHGMRGDLAQICYDPPGGTRSSGEVPNVDEGNPQRGALSVEHAAEVLSLSRKHA